ncbi:hypothetical protein D3C84_1082170 [compost metagenome]
MSALARSSIANPGREQVSLEEPVTYYEVIDVRQAAFCVQEDEVQFVLPHGLIVPLNNIHRLCLLYPVQCIDFAQCIPGGCQQADLAR